MNQSFSRPSLSKKMWFLLFVAAFFIRASVMHFFIQPHGFYKQADSFDYHLYAICLGTGNGMHRPDTQEPVFWRTPGYSAYLAPFYTHFGIKSLAFEDNSKAQEAAIWLQILLASFIPIIFFYLAAWTTQHYTLALALAWIGVVHPGLVLATTYLLTEGLALIFFYLFLLYLYKLILAPEKKSWIGMALLAAATLSIYTWMRPMGEFIAFFSALLVMIAANGTWRMRLKKGLLFFTLFFLSIAPWYVRNYKLTGEWFFCPTIGTYLNVFCAPKILRRTTGKNILECHKVLQQQAGQQIMKKKQELQGTGLHVSNNICKKVSYPIIARYPFFFMFDWIAEVIKTTLDLYSYQLIPMLDNSFWYDPIEEYLPEKISACLFAHEMPIPMRLICWAEFLATIMIWIGLFGGLWLYVIKPLVAGTYSLRLLKVWLIFIPMIGIVVGLTGGFGYARLRLPAEPLILILSLSFWVWFTRKQK